MGGSAILLAAEALVDQLRDSGAKHFGCEPGDVTASDGYIRYGTKSIELAAFAAWRSNDNSKTAN